MNLVGRAYWGRSEVADGCSCRVGIKAFKTSLSAGLSACHIPQSVHRWPVLPTSGVRFVQLSLIACSTVLAESTQEHVKKGKPLNKMPR